MSYSFLLCTNSFTFHPNFLSHLIFEKFACEGGYKDIAIHLVKYRDASIDLRDNWGKSPIDYADGRINKFGSELIAAARRLPPPPPPECDLCHNPVIDTALKIIRLCKLFCDIPDDDEKSKEDTAEDDW